MTEETSAMLAGEGGGDNTDGSPGPVYDMVILGASGFTGVVWYGMVQGRARAYPISSCMIP